MFPHIPESTNQKKRKRAVQLSLPWLQMEAKHPSSIRMFKRKLNVFKDCGMNLVKVIWTYTARLGCIDKDRNKWPSKIPIWKVSMSNCHNYGDIFGIQYPKEVTQVALKIWLNRVPYLQKYKIFNFNYYYIKNRLII